MKVFINRIAALIIKHLDGGLTTAEQLELDQWLAGSAEAQRLFNQVKDKNYVQQQLEKLYDYDAEAGWEKLKEKYTLENPPVISMVRKGNWSRRIAIAASIILLLGVGAYWLFYKTGKPVEIVKTTELPDDVAAPVTNRAMITLSDGQKVYLDSAGSGTLVKQKGVSIVKLEDGKITYKGATKEIAYNTLTNPRGSKIINMMLTDGSMVWLNAGSSLTYPVSFVGNERKVSITGEAYFEIAHNAAMPFKVSKGEMEVEVLGTHFNVNTYDDEPDIKVTLLEGSVKVVNHESAIGNQQTAILKPRQQASISSKSKKNSSIPVQTVDVEAVIAWKNGLFQFDHANLQSVLREVARWYNMDIVYEEDIPTRQFGGKINRSSNLSAVLEILKESQVNFRVEGEKIVVMK